MREYTTSDMRVGRTKRYALERSLRTIEENWYFTLRYVPVETRLACLTVARLTGEIETDRSEAGSPHDTYCNYGTERPLSIQ